MQQKHLMWIYNSESHKNRRNEFIKKEDCKCKLYTVNLISNHFHFISSDPEFLQFIISEIEEKTE